MKHLIITCLLIGTFSSLSFAQELNISPHTKKNIERCLDYNFAVCVIGRKKLSESGLVPEAKFRSLEVCFESAYKKCQIELRLNKQKPLFGSPAQDF